MARRALVSVSFTCTGIENNNPNEKRLPDRRAALYVESMVVTLLDLDSFIYNIITL